MRSRWRHLERKGRTSDDRLAEARDSATLRVRSYASFVLVLVLLFASSSTAFLALRALQADTLSITEVSDPKERAAADFKFAVTSLYEYQGHYVLGQHVDPRREFLATQRQVDQRLDDLSMRSTEPEEHQSVVAIRNRYNLFLDEDTACWTAIEAGNTAEAIRINQTVEAAQFRSIVGAIDEYIARTRATKAAQVQHFEDTTHRTRLINALLIGSAVILAVAFAGMIRRLERQTTQLRLQDDRFRSLVQHSSDIILVLDADGASTYCSPSAVHLLGLDRDQNLRDLLTTESSQHLDALLAELAEDPEHTRLLEVSTHDPARTFEVHVTNLMATPGVQGVVLNMRDVTERRQLAQQQTNAQKLESVGRLAAGIAHEINTPLQFVGDNVRFLAQAYDDFRPVADAYGRSAESSSQDSATSIRTAWDAIDHDFLITEVPMALAEATTGLDRIRSIVGAMKKFGHPDDEYQVASDVAEIVDTTLTVATGELTGIATVDVDLDPLPPVVCWPGELGQVLLNLLVNAAQAIGDANGDNEPLGAIAVRASHDAEHATVTLSVADTGPGIPADVQPQIFDPFFTTKEIGRGTGQGLAFVHASVERHAGSVWFDTSDEGTTFHVRLPVEGTPKKAPGEINP